MTQACLTGLENALSSLALLFMPTQSLLPGSLLSREEDNTACDLTRPQAPFRVLCLSGCLKERTSREGSGVVNRTVEQKHLREY